MKKEIDSKHIDIDDIKTGPEIYEWTQEQILELEKILDIILSKNNTTDEKQKNNQN